MAEMAAALATCFQIDGVEAAHNVIVRHRFKRGYVLSFFQKLPPCSVGIEPPPQPDVMAV
jgi:hypothetical protein